MEGASPFEPGRVGLLDIGLGRALHVATNPPPESQDHARLVDNITDELLAQNALRDLGLTDDVLRSIAAAVATNVDYAFDVRWSPRWEGHADRV